MLTSIVLWLVGFVFSILGFFANGITAVLLSIPSVTLALVGMYQRVYALTNPSIAGALLSALMLLVAVAPPVLVLRAIVGVIRLIRGVR